MWQRLQAVTNAAEVADGASRLGNQVEGGEVELWWLAWWGV